MRSRYEVSLNNEALSSIHPNIYVSDISYTPASIKTESYTVAKRDGARINRRYIDKASVTVQFMVRIYNPIERQEVCSRIIRWARDGGNLRTSDRYEQTLQCTCDNFPAIASSHQWTDTLSLTFTAYEKPYWESINTSSITLNGTTGSGNLFVPGDAFGAYVSVTVHANAALTSAVLTVEGRTLSLTGLNVASGKDINITYTDQMIQRIMVDSTSLLDKRTGADDLIAECGKINTFSFETSASANVTFNAKGAWL